MVFLHIIPYINVEQYLYKTTLIIIAFHRRSGSHTLRFYDSLAEKSLKIENFDTGNLYTKKPVQAFNY